MSSVKLPTVLLKRQRQISTLILCGISTMTMSDVIPGFVTMTIIPNSLIDENVWLINIKLNIILNNLKGQNVGPIKVTMTKMSSNLKGH